MSFKGFLASAMAVVALALSFGPGPAQGKELGKDHPLVSRMPNFVIVEYEFNFAEAGAGQGESEL